MIPLERWPEDLWPKLKMIRQIRTWTNVRQKTILLGEPTRIKNGSTYSPTEWESEWSIDRLKSKIPFGQVGPNAQKPVIPILICQPDIEIEQ